MRNFISMLYKEEVIRKEGVQVEGLASFWTLS